MFNSITAKELKVKGVSILDQITSEQNEAIITVRVMSSLEKRRYNIRSTVERSYSHLKDNFITSKLYVKGYKKVNCVLMTAVLCLSAVKIFTSSRNF